MRQKSLIAWTMILACATTLPAWSGEAHPLTERCQQEVARWVRSHAVSTDDQKAYARKLTETFTGLHVVGLGQGAAASATTVLTGSRKEITQFLVKEQGFNLLGVEASYPECERINELLLSTQGDVRQVLGDKRLFGNAAAEIDDIIVWLQEYNRSQPPEKRVRFFGYDALLADQTLSVVQQYLHAADPKFDLGGRHLAEAYSLFQDYGRSPARTYEETAQRGEIIRQQARELGGAINELMPRMNPQARYFAGEALACLERLSENVEYDIALSQPHAPVLGVHDKFMAGNIESVLKQRPNSRAVIWGQNYHLAKATHDDCGLTRTDRPLGSYLGEHHGQQYYAVAALSGLAPEGFLEGAFTEVKRTPCFVDLGELSPKAAAAVCLLHDTFMRTAGSGTGETTAMPVRRDDFDGLLYGL